MKKFIIAIFLVQGLFAQSSDFESYKNEFDQYSKQMQNEFEDYKRVYMEEFTAFKKEVAKHWPTEDITTKDTWVEYSQDLQEKKVVDYENGNISLEVIAQNEKEAKEKIANMVEQLKGDTTVSAYEKDKIEQNALQKLGQKKEKIQEVPMVSDVISVQQLQKKKEDVKKQDIKVTMHKDKKIYKHDIKLPPDSIMKKADTFKPSVQKNSQKNKVPANLVFAIMHSESSFNPMARSHIPAFGLMQIVPNSAGKDVNNFLRGQKVAPSSNFLYNPDNSILFGSTYLHILYYRYLSKIKDPQSRIYCVIAAYNTGAGNVARAFTGSNNTSKAARKINTMTPQQVYDHLVKNLPYDETKKYLVKVSDRLSLYADYVKQ